MSSSEDMRINAEKTFHFNEAVLGLLIDCIESSFEVYWLLMHHREVCMDTVFIRELEISTYIGIHDWEQEKRQTVLVDLDLPTSIDVAAQHDDIADALDYEKVVSELKALLESSRFQLLESMAKAIADYLYHQWQIIDAEIRITKLKAMKSVAAVGVVYSMQSSIFVDYEEEKDLCQDTRH